MSADTGDAASPGARARALLVLTTLAALSYAALPPGFALRWDNVNHNLPLQLEVQRQIAAGEPPLWDPYRWSGFPLLADPLSQTLYPPTRLVFALRGHDHQRVYDLLYCLHAVLGGFFLYLYAGALGASFAGALLGAIVYAFNPHFMFLGGAFINWFSTFAWIPLVFYALERLARGAPASGTLALGGAAVALQWLAGYPQLSAYTLPFVAAYALARALALPERRRALVTAAVLVPLLGTLLAFVQVAPTMELAAATQRATAPGQGYGQTFVHWLGLAAIALPGVPAPPTIANNAWTHLGLLPCLLALYALRRPDGVRLFLGGMALVAVCLAAGPSGHLFPLVQQLPVLGLFRGPVKFLPFAVLAIAALAALGLTDWRREGTAPALRWLLAAGIVAAVVAGILAPWKLRFWPDVSVWDPVVARWQVITSALGAALVLGTALVGRGRQARALAIAATLLALGIEASAYWRPTGFSLALLDLPPDLARLFRTPLPDGDGRPGRVAWAGPVGQYHEIELANGYGAFIKRDYALATHWTDLGGWGPWTRALGVLQGTNRALDVVSLRYFSVLAPHVPSALAIRGVAGTPRFRVAAEAGQTVVLENLQPLPRLFLAPRARAVPTQADALALLAGGDVDPAATPLVEGPAPVLDATGGEARLVAVTPGTLRVATRADGAALLVASDAWDPGWRARIDGAPASVRRVNGLVRGVVVPAGEHEVVLAYRPASLVRGAAVSGATALCLVALLLASRLSRRDGARSR